MGKTNITITMILFFDATPLSNLHVALPIYVHKISEQFFTWKFTTALIYNVGIHEQL